MRQRWCSSWGLGACGLVVLAVAGCNKPGGTVAEVASVPARAGEVWELDRVADRAAAPAALAAYVNGLHVVLIDGDHAYAGMTRLRTRAGGDGERLLHLASGKAVRLVAVGDTLDLRFDSGESIPLRRQAPRK